MSLFEHQLDELQVNLWEFEDGNTDADEKFYTKMETLRKRQSPIKTLRLVHNNQVHWQTNCAPGRFSEGCSHALAEFLKNDPNINEFHLQYQAFLCPGFQSVIDVLSASRTITTLHLMSLHYCLQFDWWLQEILTKSEILTTLVVHADRSFQKKTLFTALGRNRSLLSLSIDSLVFSPGIRGLGEALSHNPALRELKIDRISACTQEALSVFAHGIVRNHRLKTLCFDTMAFSHEKTMIHPFMGAIRQGHCIENLVLRSSLGDAHLEYTRLLLGSLTYSQQLSWGGGLGLLGESLAISTLHLEKLVVPRNELRHYMEEQQRTCRCFEITHCRIEPLAENSPFAPVFVQLGSLTTLSLHGTRLDYRDITSLCDSLQANPSHSLSTLDLGKTFDSGPVDSLCCVLTMLKKNIGLTYVDLSDNKLADAEALQIADLLAEDEVLTSLCLNDNLFTDHGACAVAQALPMNHSLTRLEMWWNPVTEVSIEPFRAAVQSNLVLQNLLLFAVPIWEESPRDEELCDLWAQVELKLERNRKLTKRVLDCASLFWLCLRRRGRFCSDFPQPPQCLPV